ncbi:formate_TAT, formate dehydrogenase region TAT target [Burkholderiaceae bacterium]
MDSKKTQQTEQNTKPSRRKFFIGAGATVGAAAVVSQTPIGQALVQEVGTAVAGSKDGYHLTAHIKKYYQTTLV